MGKKILLMTPPYHTGIIEVSGTWPPLSLVYIGGHLRDAGFDVEIYDAMTLYHDLANVKDKIASCNPDVVMIGSFTCSINTALDVLQLCKEVKSDIVTCLGGVHATFMYQQIFDEHHQSVDFIIRGEGELTAVELMQNLAGSKEYDSVAGIAFYRNGQLVVTENRLQITSLDALIPAWDLLDWQLYKYSVTGRRLAVISSSRGCNHTCSFCSQHLFWQGNYRQRTPENFVAEIEYLHKTYGVGMFMFGDEYSTKDRERWEQILDLLIEKNLDVHFSMETRADAIIRDADIMPKYRQAGFIHVYVGVESVSEEVLLSFEKQVSVDQGKLALQLLNQADIITECSFIMGHPDETIESMDRTLQLAIEYNPDLAHFLLIAPWPYTPIYNEFKDHIIEHDYSKYHFVYPIVQPKQISRDQLWDKIIDCFRKFYMRKAHNAINSPDSFKKRYMIRSIQIMHQEFFVHNFGHKTVQMPAAMGQAIEQALSGVGEYKANDVVDMLGIMDSQATITQKLGYSLQELDEEILGFIKKGLDNLDEVEFSRLALKEFQFQYYSNSTYREFCDQKGKNPDNVDKWEDIPAIPTQAFKQAIVASFPLEQAELALLTSGTTNPHQRGKIYRDKDSLQMILMANYMIAKEYLFPDVERMRILLLVPSPEVAPAMAMAYGLQQVKNEFGTDDSMYLITPNGFETDLLITALREAEADGQPVALIGATSGFVFFFNQCRELGLKFSLPVGSRVCDGGGYQGTFGECPREEYYQLVQEYLHIPQEMCVNTLGMSESGTNYFDHTLYNHFSGKPTDERFKKNLPWTRTTAVGARTGQRLPKGEVGLLRHYDLTNRATVIAVQTENLGYETEDGFEIIGRVSSELSGLGMMPTSVKDWILAGTKGQAEALKDGGGHPPMMGGHPPMMGGHPPMMGGHPPMMGGHPPMMGGHPPMMGGHPPMMGGHPPMMGGHPPMMGGHPPTVGGHPPMMGGHPPMMGGHPPTVGGCSQRTADLITNTHGVNSSAVEDKSTKDK